MRQNEVTALAYAWNRMTGSPKTNVIKDTRCFNWDSNHALPDYDRHYHVSKLARIFLWYKTYTRGGHLVELREPQFWSQLRQKPRTDLFSPVLCGSLPLFIQLQQLCFSCESPFFRKSFKTPLAVSLMCLEIAWLLHLYRRLARSALWTPLIYSVRCLSRLSQRGDVNLFRLRNPRCIFSSTLYPQSCWRIIQIIHSL